MSDFLIGMVSTMIGLFIGVPIFLFFARALGLYAVMLAVILVLVIGTIRLVGSNANNAFSAVASSLQ